MRSQYVQWLRSRTELLANILLQKRWQVWIAPRGCGFVTSDSPVMTLRFDEGGRYYVGDGFAKQGVVAILPLSPKACLFAGLQGNTRRTVTEHDVWEINKVVISSSLRFTYSTYEDRRIDALVQEFTGSIHYGVDAFRATADTVDLLF